MIRQFKISQVLLFEKIEEISETIITKVETACSQIFDTAISNLKKPEITLMAVNR